MWNSAEGLETYANCLDLKIEGAAVAVPPGSGNPGGGGGGAAGGAGSNQGAGGGGGGAAGPVIGVIVALAVVGGLVYWFTKVYPHLPTHPPTPPAACLPPCFACLPSCVPTLHYLSPQVRGKAAGPGAPPPPLSAPDSSLPPGWTEAKDPASGQQYYFNATTLQTQWIKPNPNQV